MNRIYVMAFLIAAAVITYFAFEQSRQKVTAQRLPVLHKLPEPSLKTHSGLELSKENLTNKIVIVSLTPTKCDASCQVVYEVLGNVLKSGSLSKVALISLLSDYSHEQQGALSDLIKKFKHPNDPWYFISERNQQTEELERIIFKDGTRKHHSSQLILIDQDRQVRGHYDSRNPNAIKSMIYHAAALSQQKSV